MSIPFISKPASEDLVTPKEVAECKVDYELLLPAPLDLSQYKLDSTTPYTDADKQKVQELILVLKNRIYELQEIIKDANK